ncbi:hypothetical protein HS1genome_1515 [Sulfodiicoccus acidiphilus]|uniref:Rubrerythrin n=1 Tax=Sulfodiicoccus acidiphilus TaxID=1670455 RepID=A0A348B4M4_9CREN|nr:hypothetical protein HS1genome_1515 [Sulfodiicoccus acidiphilus]GGU00620.1 hypothetical protein GCM10007116_17320 [Sulfodiicoccus acidiphilus]
MKAYSKYGIDVLFTSFMMGEAAATTVFTGAAKNAKVDQFREAFKNTAVDETRHYAFTHLVLTDAAARISDEEKRMVTKQIRAGFVFLSLITYKKPSEFWKLPPWFQEVHEQMEELAREAGLGIPTLEEKEKAWRDAVIKVGVALKRYGVRMPAIPELGVTGEEVEESGEEDVVPVF